MEHTWISINSSHVWQQHTLHSTPDVTSQLNFALTGNRYQQLEGFRVCFNELGWTVVAELSVEQRDQILRDLFHSTDSCRFTLCRLPIGTSNFATDMILSHRRRYYRL